MHNQQGVLVFALQAADPWALHDHSRSFSGVSGLTLKTGYKAFFVSLNISACTVQGKRQLQKTHHRKHYFCTSFSSNASSVPGLVQRICHKHHPCFRDSLPSNSAAQEDCRLGPRNSIRTYAGIETCQMGFERTEHVQIIVCCEAALGTARCRERGFGERKGKGTIILLMVTRLAWIAQRLQSSKRWTIKSSAACEQQTMASQQQRGNVTLLRGSVPCNRLACPPRAIH